jgi:hypothetical protein
MSTKEEEERIELLQGTLDLLILQTLLLGPTHTQARKWLNQAEIEIGLLYRQCLGTRRLPDVKSLRRESRAWNRRMNRDRLKINWTFDRKAARPKFGYTKYAFTRS